MVIIQSIAMDFLTRLHRKLKPLHVCGCSGIGFISPARFVSSSLDMSGKSWHGPFKARSNPSCQHCFGQPPGVKSFKPRMLRNLSPLKAVQGSAEGQHRYLTCYYSHLFKAPSIGIQLAIHTYQSQCWLINKN